MTTLFLLLLTAQDLPPWTIHRLPDTGQTRRYATARGEDAEFSINPPTFERNAEGIVTDLVTGLYWQQTDSGETTWEAAVPYCQNLRLGGFSDWRLPSAHELFTIQNHSVMNPSLDTTTAFTRTAAEYWWSGDKRIDDKTFAWATNSGGGIGAHRLNETRSAGGTKLYHARCVRHSATGQGLPNLYTVNDDGTVTDNRTGLIWQRTEAASAVTWEEALQLASETDGWRVPNIKELRSLQSDLHLRPTIDPTAFPGTANAIFWSSTTQVGQQGVTAWTLDFSNGVVSYNLKTSKQHLRLVRGGTGARIAFGGIRNAASGVAADIAANEIVSIFGSQFKDTVVKINGERAEVLALQEDRIDILTPASIAGLEATTVQVDDSPLHAVRVAPASPGIFTTDGSGSGTAQTDAIPTRGATVSIVVTGYGVADPAPAMELLLDAQACEIKLAEVLEPGKLRIGFRVPVDAPTGKPLALELRIAGKNSQTGVTLEIQ